MATDLVEEGAKYVARELLPDYEMDKCSSNDDSPPGEKESSKRGCLQ